MPAKVGETAEAFTPMSVEEARALVTEAGTDLDRDTLLAERAEAEAQVRAAQATLGVGIDPPAPNGESASEQEPDEPAQKTQDVDAPNVVATLDVEELRRAAAAARAADDVLARAASEASERPPAEPGLDPAESALSRALEIQEDLPAAWRRLVGALISATGMAIVVGALGWNIYWLLVPIALIAILTVDLRLSGRAAREASAEAAGELATVGGEGAASLDRIRLQRVEMEEAEARLAAARADRDEAYARFDELAPGRRPSEVEDIIADHHAAMAAAAASASEAAARRAAADAGRLLAESLAEDAAEEPVVQPTAAPAAAQPAKAEVPAAQPAEAEVPAAQPTAAPAAAQPAEAEVAAEAPAEPAEAEVLEPEAAEGLSDADVAEVLVEEEPVPEPVAEAAPTASQWWFGSMEAPAPPPAAPAPVRALAERLSAEGREALARIEAQLAALERIELAKKSLEWHESNGSAEKTDPAEDA